MAFISYTERPILALGLAGEADAGLTWVDFNLMMPQETPIRWALNSWAAQANHGPPNTCVISSRRLSESFQQFYCTSYKSWYLNTFSLGEWHLPLKE